MKLIAFAYGSNYIHEVLKNGTSEYVESENYSDYYVSTDGNDNNSGLTPELAWKTIAKVNSSAFLPGDRILFKRGDEWREQLNISQSGTVNAKITFMAYGTGAKPIINAADLKTGWVGGYNTVNPNIWGIVDPSKTSGFTLVVINDILYTEVATLAELTSPNKYWIKTASTPDSIYVYSEMDPNDLVAQVSARSYGIYSFDKQYITISNLDVRNAGDDGIRFVGTTYMNGYCTVDSVNAYRNRLAGIFFEQHGHDTVTNCIATYNGFGILGWKKADNMIVTHCYTAHSVHNNIGDPRGGAWSDATGIQFYCSNNVIVEYCESFDDPIGIFLDPYDVAISTALNNTMTARYNYIHDAHIGTDRMVMGIGINKLGAGGAINVYYNLIVNCSNDGYGNIELISTYAGSVNVFNNTVVVNGSRNDVACVYVPHPLNTVFKNNIYYYDAKTNIYSTAFTAIGNELFTSDYNQYYETKAVDKRFLKYNSTAYKDLTTWQAVIGQDTHSQLGNPLFVSISSDWSLQESSPCINKGTIINGIPQTDILGNPIVGLPDIGAFEAQFSSYTPTPLYLNSVVQNASPSILEMIYDLSLANIVPTSSAFSVKVNSVARTVNSVAVSGTKVLLTLASPVVNGDVVTVAYIKPSTNPLQTASGAIAVSIGNQPVINNCINVAPTVVITSPMNNSSFSALANITITANALDTDGSINTVEFYNGNTKIGSKSSAPYSLTWSNVSAGTYSLTVIATDNLNAKTISSAISISVNNGTTTANQPPVITISNPSKGNKYEKLATISIDAIASDPDGTISKVEFYNGITKLVELTSAPYSYTWKDIAPGTYSLTAIATDNLNATTTSSSVEFVVLPNIKYDANSEIINLYPNPNDGHFSIDFVNPLQNEKYEVIIVDLTGKQVYRGPLLKEEITKQFDLSYIMSGIYIMMIFDKVIFVTKKFIIK